jgi:rhomboid family GlyGly-CTERM serine protease
MSSPSLSFRKTDKLLEFLVFAALLIVFNFPLLYGSFFDSMIFLPESVIRGEWWRIFSHPFVHLSWYHFLLDAGAFLLLYNGIEEQNPLRRILYVAACGMGSLTLSTAVAPAIHTQGLCGLSGTAHGLMAISALETMRSSTSDKKLFRVGVITFAVVVIKSIVEVLTGQVLFAFLHFGMVGSPIAVCHAGGVLSGIIAFLVIWTPGNLRKTISLNALALNS